MKIERGDILIADLGRIPDTSIQSGVRPVVVISNDKANTYSPVLTVVPVTSKIYKKRYLPTHVILTYMDAPGIGRYSLALAEQVTSIATSSVGKKIGKVRPEALARIIQAVEVQIGVIERERF